MITTQMALASLRPKVEWVMRANDVENITWITPDVQPLTTDEVEAEINRLEKEEADKIKADQAATLAAIAHAKSLGFTDAMIAVMYPNLRSEALIEP